MTVNLAATGQLPTAVWVPLVVVATVLSVVIEVSRYRMHRREKQARDAREARLQAYLAERDEEWKRNNGGNF